MMRLVREPGHDTMAAATQTLGHLLAHAGEAGALGTGRQVVLHEPAAALAAGCRAVVVGPAGAVVGVVLAVRGRASVAVVLLNVRREWRTVI
jgi:hypothetical protein